MKNNILIVGKLPPPKGGVSIHCYRLFKILSQSNKLDVQFYDLNQNEYNITGLIKVKGAFSLVKLLLKNVYKFDIIHYQLANYYGLIIIWIISRLNRRTKLYFTIHGEGFIERLQSKVILKRIIVYVLNKVDLIIVGNRKLKKNLFDNNILNEIDIIDAFLPPDESEDINFPDSVNNVFDMSGKKIVANGYNIDLLTEKTDLYGFHVLAWLAEKLNSENVNFKMMILVSKINNKKYISQLFDDIPNTYIFSDNSIPGWKFISKGDIMIRPTSTDANAFSLKEALMFGVYAIASDVVPRYEGVETYKYNDNNDLYNKVMGAIRLNKKPDLVVDNQISKYMLIYEKQS